MLMAMAITLLMMAAVVTLFANLSGSIRNRRAVIELSGQLRQVRQRLARDLAGCTVPPGDGGLIPWRQRPGEGIGYFEIQEGKHSDFDPSDYVDGDKSNGEIEYATSFIPSGGDPHSLLPEQVINKRLYDESDITNGGGLGDADDVLALTVRTLDEPFVAQLGGGGQVESNLAEVFWYSRETQFDDPATTSEDESGGKEPGMRTVYRRVLLIAPWLDPSVDRYDNISMHQDLQTGKWVPNTLADLTRREFRTAHIPINTSPTKSNFPYELDVKGEMPGGAYEPKYIVLQDALAFDVRVYDPGAPLYETGGVVVDPGDPGWLAQAKAKATRVGYGAYVDLGWNSAGDYLADVIAPVFPSFQFEHRVGWTPQQGADPTFSIPNPTPDNPFRGGTSVYDTWSWHYENDGIDQDDKNGNDNFNDGDPTTGAIDEGRNGVDDLVPVASGPARNFNGVDDVAERETSPPYPVALRGVKVVLRTYERDARQIREASVTNSFVP
jgi:hypothetical protein